MAYEKGKIVDVPIFDRLPIVCASGQEPRVPKDINNCLKNSGDDGKKGCKCRKGFEDAMTIPTQPALRTYGEGRRFKEVSLL